VAEAYRAAGVKDLTVVRGYKKETVNLPSIAYVDNDAWEKTQELGSLAKALPKVDGPTIVSYGDVLFKKYVLQQLMDVDADFAVAIDPNWQQSKNRGRLADYAVCSQPHGKQTLFAEVSLEDVVNDPEAKRIDGEWMGFLKVSDKGAKVLTETFAKLDDRAIATLKMPDLIRTLIKAGHKVRVVYTTGWLDVDSVQDVVTASAF
jgi:phosphoenolpyruvate phosphomutase